MTRFDNQEFIYLADGRKLGYQQYGDKKGFPILGFHGTPGSRLWFEEDDPVSQKFGIRLITVDRPGYGISDPKPHREIKDFNGDIQELVNHLEVSPFSAFGVSGGGAYALSLGCTDNNIHKIGLVASVSPFWKGKPSKNMARANRLGVFLARHLPWLLKRSYKYQKQILETDPDSYKRSISSNKKHLCKSDQEVIMREPVLEAMILQMKEAFRTSSSEVVNELKLLSDDWNVDLSKLQVPIEVWHGKEDTLSPLVGIQELIEKIPLKNVHLLEDKGHFLDEDPGVWKDLLKSLM